jgi:hypothetical protein
MIYLRGRISMIQTTHYTPGRDLLAKPFTNIQEMEKRAGKSWRNATADQLSTGSGKYGIRLLVYSV